MGVGQEVGSLYAKIGADISGLQSGLGAAKGLLGSFGNDIIGALTSPAAAFAAAGALLATGIKSAIGEEQAMAGLGATVVRVGGNFEAFRSQTETVIGANRLLGKECDSTIGALDVLTQSTKNYNRSLELLPLATDLATARHMDLGTAAMLVGKVAEGNVGILGRYAIEMQKGATSSQALTEMQKRFGGAAAAAANTTAGQLTALKLQFGELVEVVGSAFLPGILAAAKALTDFATVAIPRAQAAVDHLNEALAAGRAEGGTVYDPLTDSWYTAAQAAENAARAAGTFVEAVSGSDAALNRAQFAITGVSDAVLGKLGPALASVSDTDLSSVFSAEKFQAAMQGVEKVAIEHEQAMAEITAGAAASQLDAEFNAGVQRAQALQQHRAEMVQAEAQYQAQMAILRAAGNADGMAELTTKFDNERATMEQQFEQQQTLSQNNETVQQQIRQRSALVQEAVAQQSYINQLQEQYRAVDASLGLAVEEAKNKGLISVETASALLDVLNTSGTAKLTSESLYVQGSMELAKQWASGQITSVDAAVGAYEALAQARAGELGAAKDKLAALKTQIANFKVTLPPLTLPALPTGGMGGLGQSVKETTQKVLTDAVIDMQKGIEAGKQAIIDLLGFELPKGWEVGLEKFGEAAVVMATKFNALWQRAKSEFEGAGKAAESIQAMGDAASSFTELMNIEAPSADWESKFNAWINAISKAGARLITGLQNAKKIYGVEALKEVAELAGYSKAVMDLLGVSVDIKAPPKDFGKRLDAWLAATAAAGARLISGLQNAQRIYGAQALEKAGKIGESVQKIMGLLGVDLSKIGPAPMLFGQRLQGYLLAMDASFKAAYAMLDSLSTRYGPEKLESAAKIAENVSAVFGIFDLKLADIKAPQSNFKSGITAWVSGLTSAADIAIPALEAAQAKWGDGIEIAAGVASNIAMVFGSITDISQSVADAADLGGIDVESARALIAQLSELTMPSPGMIAPTFGDIIPGAPAGGGADIAALSAAIDRIAAWKPSGKVAVQVEVSGLLTGGGSGEITLDGAEETAQNLYAYAALQGSTV